MADDARRAPPSTGAVRAGEPGSKKPPPARRGGSGASPPARRRRRPPRAAGAPAARSRRARPAGGGPSRLVGAGEAELDEPLVATAARAGIAVPVDPVAEERARVVRANRRRAAWLAAAPLVVLAAVGAGVGAAAGAGGIGAAGGALAGAVVAAGLWRGATGLVLGALGARAVDEDEAPGPLSQLENLCATMGLAVPTLYLVDDALPEALALGRASKGGAVVLSSGLITRLDPVAAEAVLAHELAHLKRHDTAPATVASALALLSGVGSGLGGRLVHRLAGPGREFDADRHAVSVTRYPPALARALASMAAARTEPGAARGPLARTRAGQLMRWLFTVAVPERDGRLPDAGPAVGELDAPAVRVAALEEW
jgi:Zn-dependent protease with chaperone function